MTTITEAENGPIDVAHLGTMQAARDDLAFLRAIAEDTGGPPRIMGLHVLAIGAIFGANLIAIWAGLTFDFGLPETWLRWSWAPGAILYIPVVIWLSIAGRQQAKGPTARLFAAAWAAIGFTCLPIILLTILAASRTGVPYYEIWPALSFLLYGGAWAALGVIRRRAWHGAVALGCLATSFAAAMLIGQSTAWLVMGLGLILFMAVPGWAILRIAPKQD